MSEKLRYVSAETVITSWDFSTTGVKCLAFDIHGDTLASVRLPTDLWTEGGVSELNLHQLEGQAHGSVRAIANRLFDQGRLHEWAAGGISATHHTAGRIDEDRLQVRRAICWNDQSLAEYHQRGLERLGGQKKVRELIGGPWAERYSLSHLVKDEETLDKEDWERTWRILPHGPLAGGFLTGHFERISLSAAASTGICDLRTGKWRKEMLDAIGNADYRKMAWNQLPEICDHFDPLGRISAGLARDAGLDPENGPLVFPNSDDQQAGLIGGGAVDAGQMAIILGSSAVVNASSDRLPETDDLDAMRLNWGPYLWMRCYSNGAQFLDRVVGKNPDWNELENAARKIPPGSNGATVLPFVLSEPSLGVAKPKFTWLPNEPSDVGTRYRASLEALAYLIVLGVRQHEEAGGKAESISVSGGIARSKLMCEILASVLGKPLKRLQSDEGPALGAAITALAGLETHLRRENGDDTPYTVADAVAQMVKYREPVEPNTEWRTVYQERLAAFEKLIRS